ncbi:MAG TPA: LamG-like jellyroll fold domain-containing protein [Friedmanniella sp.]
MTSSGRSRSLGALLAAGTAVAMIAPASPALAAASNTWSDKSAPLTTPWTAQVSPTNALPDYPRPQLARPSVAKPRWQSLNGLWEYEPSDGYTRPVVGQKLAGQILVPYPAESALSGVMEHSDFMLYRRTVTIPRSFRTDQQHVRLNFGAVNYAATVWVNGTKLVEHTGGYEAFSVDITSALRKTGRQEIVVGVASPVDSENIPVGKQRLDPSGIFYTAASGIWQSVWLEPVARTSLDAFTATPNADLTSFTLSAALNGPAKNARLTVKAYAGKKKVGSVSGKAGSQLRLKIKRPRLWSPADPFLYTFKVTLKRGASVDKVESYAGMRTIGLKQINGKQRIVLNGRPTFLLATLDQGYWPDGISTAPTDEALKFDIQKTKDLGFNTIRKHIKVEPARWYYWADRLGMMVWQDQPALPTGRNDRLTTSDKANLRSETARMVDQLKGVTSIIGWVPFNEGWGQWSVQAATNLGDQVKRQDPTRLVDSRSGSNCCDTPGDPGNGDVIDYHQYQGPALPAPDAKRASIDGEHGGLTLSVPGHLWPTASIDPYGSVKDAAALNDAYVANNDLLRDLGARNGLSGGVYTQITDVEGEQNGFFTYDRQVEKVDEARIRASNLSVIAAGSEPAPPPPVGTPGLGGVGHWTLDEGAGTTAADSAGSHPLTLRGEPTWVDGPTADAKTALHLTGGQSAETATTVVPTRGANFSVSAWVRLDSADGAFQTVVSEDGDTNSAFFLQYSGADQRWAFSFVGARALAADLGQPKTGRWYHLVGVRDTTTSTLTIYVDGQPAGSTSVLATPDDATGVLAVGRGKFGGKPVDYLDGAVDDVKVFDRALSASEVTVLEEAGAQ